MLQLCRKNVCHYFPVNGNWGPWGKWGACSKTCGEASDPGIRKRKRLCDSPKPSPDGMACDGNKEQADSCPLVPCINNFGRTTHFTQVLSTP